jgi:hypothetical protein
MTTDGDDCEYFDEINESFCEVPECTPNRREENRQVFEESDYTLEDYRDGGESLNNMKDHIERLRKFIAFITGGYIIKRRSNKRIKYEEIKTSELKTYLPTKFTLTIPQKESKPKRHSFQSAEVVKEHEYAPRFASYAGLKLLTDEEGYLTIWRPPVGEYIEGYGEKWQAFFESRVNNPVAFREEIYSHAARLREPNVFIEKVFCHYSEQGGTGKSLLSSMLAMIYGDYANANVKHAQLTGRFGAFTSENLMVQVEELQKGEYHNKDFETFIKQGSGSRENTIERKFKQATKEDNTAILGFNTNQPDLYGIIRADPALIDRLVILDYKDVEGDKAKFWQKAKVDLLMDDANARTKKRNVAYTLYKYLLEELVIPDDFDPFRYYKEDKRNLIQALRNKSRNTTDGFFTELAFASAKNGRQNETDQYNLLEKTTVKGIGYVWAKRSDINNAYKFYAQQDTQGKHVKNDNVIKYFTDKGFKEVKDSKGTIILRIPEEEYAAMAKPEECEVWDPVDEDAY